MSPFEAKGDRPEWQMIYDVLARGKVGDVIEYPALDKALGRDFRNNRHPLERAIRELLNVKRRTVENMPGKGYRVVAASEHERLARQQQKFARRRIAKGLRTTRGTDRSQLTPEEALRLDRLEIMLADQQEALRRHESRIAKLEEVAKKASRQKSSDDQRRDERVEKLYEALKRSGIDIEEV